MQERERLRIGLITRDALLVDALSIALGPKAVLAASSSSIEQRFLRSLTRLKPRVLALDIADVQEPIALARDLQQWLPDCKLVLISDRAMGEVISSGLSIGALAFVVKAEGLAELVPAIHDASKGVIHLSRLASIAYADALAHPTQGARPLTPRESQILRRIAQGRTMRETAKELGISVRTAESHKARLKRKLGIKRTADLVRYAMSVEVIVA